MPTFLKQTPGKMFTCQKYAAIFEHPPPPGGVLLKILGRGMLPSSPNPDPISDQKMSFSTPVFRPDLQNPYPFSDLAFRQKLCRHNLD